MTAGAGGGEPAPSPRSNAEPPCQLVASHGPVSAASERQAPAGRPVLRCVLSMGIRAQGLRYLPGDIKPNYPASVLCRGFLEAPLWQLSPSPSGTPTACESKNQCYGGREGGKPPANQVSKHQTLGHTNALL